MSGYFPEVSVTAPVNLAIARAKQMLFQPFDMGKWFTIGFCAWLASLAEGGSRFNFNQSGGGGDFRGQPGKAPNLRQVMDEAMRWVTQNLHWIIPVVVVALVLVVAFGMLLTWLSSRGKFMFLYCVALDRAEVKRPWSEFAREGNSLFLFRFVVGLIQAILCLALAAGTMFAIGRMVYRGESDQDSIVMAVGMGVSLFGLLLCFGLVQKFTFDFVVPIMYLRRTTCPAAWNEFLGLLGANMGRFTVYVLFQIVLSIVIGVLVLVLGIATCCIGFCLMAIPYIGTVLLLPLLVFDRAYSLYYMAQYGPAYDVFPPPAPPGPFGYEGTPVV